MRFKFKIFNSVVVVLFPPVRFSHRQIAFLALLLHGLVTPPALMAQNRLYGSVIVEEKTGSGQAAVRPQTAISGEFGTWTVTYTVGDEPIAEGGGLFVQMPDAWHAGPRNSANRVQASEPQADHYVNADCSNPSVEINAVVEDETDNRLVKHGKRSLDGRSERYVFVVRVEITSGTAQPGDEIHVVYGDRSQGSAGYRAGAVSTDPLPILLALDFSGDGEFRLLDQTPEIAILPGAATHLMVHLPSQGVVNQPMNGLISLVDKEANAVHHQVIADLTLISGEAEFPQTVTVPSGQGYAEFEITPAGTGPLRLKARTRGYPLETHSNPSRIFQEEPEQKIYWGDLHSHTHYSWDGVGYDSFDYARFVSGLDFYAMTDHAISPTGAYTRGLHPGVWDEYSFHAETHNAPPHFVTLHAYECSLGSPYGHHNVFFRGAPGALITNTNRTLPQLWKALQAGQALTIPHHTGKFPSGVDFSIHDEALRRNIEIYSGHGLSEAYDPSHPLSFENSLFTSDGRSVTTPSFAQDAWRDDVYLSSIASSDDHRAHPGMPHFGLAAVKAPQLSREAIFDGLYQRATYATSGSKIIMDFLVNGHEMGRIVSLDSAPEFAMIVHGTHAIEWVELLRLLPDEKAFTVIQRWIPEGMDFKRNFAPPGHEPGAVYYLRVKQENRVRGRAVYAWSSPIWTQP